MLSPALREGLKSYASGPKIRAIYFDSAVPHAYRRVGAKPCSAIVVTAGA
jgi:hypothetical protein